MNRREFLTGLGVAAGALAQPLARRKPNVILVVIDDLGWMDLGCQGSTFYETPVIDRLAREGVRFTNAYANCPVCSPSRAALMTGRYPARVRFTGHITATGRHRYPATARIVSPDDYLHLRTEEVTLAEALAPAGYVSASIGKWHLGSKPYWPERQGFDVNVAGYDHGSPPSHFFPYKNPKQDWNSRIPTMDGGKPGEYLTDRLTEEAIRFVERNRDRPFFLYLPHYAVHTPLQAPEELTAKYAAKLQRNGSQKSAIYGAMVEAVDRSLGRLVAAVERAGLGGDTLLMVTSDNGGEPKSTSSAPLRAGKGSLYEGGIRVPLIVRRPGRVKTGQTCEEPVMGADLFPTILDLAGVAAPASVLDGVSLRPLLEGGTLGARDLFWYYPHYSPQYQQPGASVRSGDLKLIEFYDPPGLELYNLAADPGERSNLAAQSPESAAALRSRLQAWLKASEAILHSAPSAP